MHVVLDVYADMQQMETEFVHYEDDYTFDINKFIEKIDEKTSLVSLVNPSMPIGNVYNQNDIIRVLEKAKAVGAKGFKLVGCTCVGQDLQLRGSHYTEVFDGHAGNNYTSEAVLATGAIDAVISEFNCTLPGIEPICDSLKIKQICLDDVAKKANAELKPFVFEERETQSMEIIDEI